jgi:hypothetical protein
VANLSPVENAKIAKLLIAGGHVLDFSHATYGEFLIFATGQDMHSKYPDLSKGKMLKAIMAEEPDGVAGKVLDELLNYMQGLGFVSDQNRALHGDCAQIAKRLLGKSISPEQSKTKSTVVDWNKHLQELQALSGWEDSPQKRGYAFEKYLKDLFQEHGLESRGPFKITGEQIDGSFVMDKEVYLLEAKWQTAEVDKSDLVVFNDKVVSKSRITRGLFISYSEYSDV